jgi:preprotein translocase subunit SecF
MVTRRERQQRRTKRRKEHAETAAPVKREKSRSGINAFYHDNYKMLLLVPFILLFLAFIQIGVQWGTTGDFLNKGVSLEGGITITVPVSAAIDLEQLENQLRAAYPENDIMVRGISELGQVRGVTIEAASDTESREEILALEKGLVALTAKTIPNVEENYAVEVVGPSLGDAFFNQTIKAVFIAFLLMGMVVFLYFGHNTGAKVVATVLSLVGSILVFNAGNIIITVLALLIAAGLVYLYVKYSPPSAAVILAAFSDIVVTLAIVNMMGVKLSTAGIAAFLMLIGYSVDTDILLSTRVLKRTNGTIYERLIGSFKTGMTMSLTSFVAATVSYFVTQSATIKQIMLIIIIGLLADMLFTWLQNAGIVRWYAETRREEA